MLRRFHLVLGLLLLALYVYFIFHVGALFPKLAAAGSGAPEFRRLPKSGTGLLAYGLPLAAIVCFIWPQRLKWAFSPRLPPLYDYLLTESFWYGVGYFLLLVGVGLLLLFR